MIAEPAYQRSGVPEGRSGDWVIDSVVQPVRPEGAAPAVDPRPDCFHYRPGVYRRLRRGETTFMTDLYDEWFTQREGIAEACRRGGRVLVTGLGLGLVVDSMLGTPGSRVARITVVELSSDVVRLVAPRLRERWGERVEVVEADAFTWEPPAGAHYSVGWHDVWPDPHGPEVETEVAALEERYRRVCDWQGSWPSSYREASLSGRE